MLWFSPLLLHSYHHPWRTRLHKKRNEKTDRVLRMSNAEKIEISETKIDLQFVKTSESDCVAIKIGYNGRFFLLGRYEVFNSKKPFPLRQLFRSKDLDDEVLTNNTYIADLKAGRCQLNENWDKNRIIQMQRRNKLFPLQLKSSHPHRQLT